MFTLKSFYKSKEWEDLLKHLKSERISEDGLLRCECCGQPMIKAYDCIGHHKIELTDNNVNDYNISLNKDYIMLIHHRCHNKEHRRFGFEGAKKVYIVYGPPCSGKSTWVKENATSEDIILDIDNIWQMITINDRYIKPSRLNQNVFSIRDCIIEMIRMRTGKWHNAYIIGGYPLATDRERLEQLLGATSIFINESKEICLDRAKNREGWSKHIDDWFRDYTE